MERLIAALRALFDPLAGFWRSLGVRGRVSLVFLGMIVFGGLWAFRSWMTEGSFRPLYSDLTETEAAAAVERLRELKAPYRLTSGGTTILVPEDQIAELRLQLASSGLPQQGRLGFELFDQSSFGATEFAEQVNFRRALEGELEKSILSLAEVERARVHISLPRRSVFLDNEQPAKAAVVVQLRRGSRLAKQQTDGIAYMVASAVEDLQPGKVVIVDTLGNLLVRPKSDEGEPTGEQLEYKRWLETETARKILATLEPYVGFDKARANVAADVDWNAGEQTAEVLDPNSVVMTTQKSQETQQPATAAGPPGTDSNVPRQAARPAKGEMLSSRSTETTNYQTSRTVTRMGLERGVVKRLSVAVLVDAKGRYDPTSGELIREARTEQEMAVLRQLVIAAAGVVEQRGDVLTVESLQFTIFDVPPAPATDDGPAFEFSLEMLQEYRYELIGAATLVLLATLGLFLLRRRSRKRAVTMSEQQAALVAEEARKELQAAQLEAGQREAEQAVMLKGLKMASLQSPKAQALKKHLDEAARKDPGPIVELLKTWVHEDDK